MATTLFLDTFTGGAGVVTGHAPDISPGGAVWSGNLNIPPHFLHLDGSGNLVGDPGDTFSGLHRVVFDAELGTTWRIDAEMYCTANNVDNGCNVWIYDDTALVFSALLKLRGAAGGGSALFASAEMDLTPFDPVSVSSGSHVLAIERSGSSAYFYVDGVLQQSIALAAWVPGTYPSQVKPYGFNYDTVATGVSSIEWTTASSEPNEGWSSFAGGAGSTVYGSEQDMAQLIPYSRFKGFTDTNDPLVGGKVYTYAPGTSTPKDTYTDHLLGSANTNPIILDAFGEATIFIDGDTDLVLTDPDETIRWGPIRHGDTSLNATLTNTALAGDLTVTSTNVTWSGNPTHTGNHTWDGNQVFKGNNTLGDNSTDTLTIAPNAVTWSNNPTHSGNHTWSGSQTFNGNVAIGDAAGDTLSIATNAVTWGGNPTHSGNHAFSGTLLANGAASTIGYSTGSGGSVTQITSKSTAVTLNKATGQVTTHNALLAGGATAVFTFNNSLISSVDVPIFVIKSPGGSGSYRVQADGVSNGLCNVALTNLTGGNLSDTVVLNFALIKGTTT
jgi:hypothetical protein